jgi:hypothetical protein
MTDLFKIIGAAALLIYSTCILTLLYSRQEENYKSTIMTYAGKANRGEIVAMALAIYIGHVMLYLFGL